MCCPPGTGNGGNPRLCFTTALWFLFFLSNLLKTRKWEDDQGLQAEAASSQNLFSIPVENIHLLSITVAGGFLPGFSPREPHVQVIEYGRRLVTDSYPVLVYQVVGRQVSVGCSEGLLQRVPFECGHDVLLCKGTGILLKTRHLISVELGTTIPTCCSKAQVMVLNTFCKLWH